MPQSLSGILDSNIHPTLVACIVVIVHCNNFASGMNHGVNHRLPLYNLTAGQVDGLQVLVQRFRSGMTLLRFPPHLPPWFRNIIIARARYCIFATLIFGTSKKQKHIMHGQDILRINVIWSNPLRWPSECLFLWLANSNEIYFRTVNTKSCRVGVVKYKRLSSDINGNKSICLYAHYEGVWAGGCVASLISTPGTTWRWVINLAPRSLCSCTFTCLESTHDSSVVQQ